MKVLFITNIPSPYRVDFFNELGKYVDLTVLFEGKRTKTSAFNWNDDEINGFEAIFLKPYIEERVIDFSITKIISKHYDVIVATNYAYFTELYAILYMAFKHKQYVLSVDGLLMPQKKKRIADCLKRYIISKASFCMSSGSMTDNVLSYYGASVDRILRYSFSSLKNSDICNSVADQNEKKELRNKLGIIEEKVVISVGSFTYRKGMDIFIQSKAFVENNIGYYLIGGNKTEEYDSIIEQNKLSNVHFVDFKNKEELKEYYRAADVFVLATREDIWGLVINEAMACGLPVITTNRCVAGLELVEQDMIVDTEDSKAIADRINTLTSDDQLRRNIGKRNISAIAHYTIENMAKEYVAVFDKYSQFTDKLDEE